MSRCIESKTGKYDSIAAFFEKNTNKNDADLERLFNEEYPARDFSHYKSYYFKEYNLSQTRTSTCGKSCWSEPDFKAHVIDVLVEEQGHKPMPVKGLRNESGHLRMHPDIETEKNGIRYVIEVKGCYHGHRIQTGLGQLFYYEFLKKGCPKCKYILVFPEESKNASDFSDGFIEHAISRLGIEVWFL